MTPDLDNCIPDGGNADFDDAIDRHGETLLRVVQHLLPIGTRSEAELTMTEFGEGASSFSDYWSEVEVDEVGAAALSNSQWHSKNGFLLEFLQMAPSAEDDDGRTFTETQVRVFDTAHDDDPLETLGTHPDRTDGDEMAYRTYQAARGALIADATISVIGIKQYED